MNKENLKRWIVGAMLIAGSLAGAADDEYRVFRSSGGNEIRASILDYDAVGGKVRLKVEGGQRGWVPLASLSSDDQTYAREWYGRVRFLSDDLFRIKTDEEDDGWQQHLGVQEQRFTRYVLTLRNRGNADLNGLRIVCCEIREKDGGVSSTHYDLETTSVPAGETVEEVKRLRSFRNEPRHILDSVVGLRLRLYWTSEDGRELMREVSIPEKLSEEKYPWKDPVGERAKPVVDLTPRELTEQDVKALAERYVDAWEEKDFEAWLSLVEPLHYGDKRLSEGEFRRHAIDRVRILDVDGLNVLVELYYEHGRWARGWLQFHSSSTLKYTPLLFQHPVVQSLKAFAYLYSSGSYPAVIQMLTTADVPLCGYELGASEDEKQEAIEQIFEWIEENGAAHDVGTPKILIPDEQFEELVRKVRERVQAGVFGSTVILL